MPKQLTGASVAMIVDETFLRGWNMSDEKKIAAVVAWARRVIGVERSEKTAATYKAELLRMIKKGDLSAQAANRNTRSIQRAALRLGIAVKLLRAYDAKDQTEIERLIAIKENIDTAAISRAAGSSGGADNRLRRKSKKISLRGLPSDWRVRFLEEAGGFAGGQVSKYYPAMTILAATGCRPVELEKGIEVRLDDRCENLIFEIPGGKVTKKNGQRLRKLKISLEHPIANMVCTGFITAPGSALNSAVVRVGKKVFPNRTPTMQISPYSFRHAAAADFKFCGGSDADISGALGHRSTVTKSYYSPRRGAGGLRLVSVELSDDVREHAESELPESLTKKNRGDKEK